MSRLGQTGLTDTSSFAFYLLCLNTGSVLTILLYYHSSRKTFNWYHFKFRPIIIVDRIFDISNSTQDVYDEFGRPIVLSAMDGFNGEYLRLP